MTPKLTVEKVSKAYESIDRKKRVEILKDISFTVDEGEIISIIGPTGCGKTTLLRIVDGIIAPDSGQVLINGAAVKSTKNPCAMVFQNFNLLPWRNVLKNVEFGLEALGIPRQERSSTAQHYLELVGLKEYGKHHPHELSGGTQQRVGLARALAINPEVVLLDEPFSSVDILMRESLQEEVLKILQATKKTAVFVTHNINEALFLSDRIISLTAKPSGIKAVYNVNLPHPRNDEVLRSAVADKLIAEMRRDLLEPMRSVHETTV
jgi:NitT/TauT family transport system ATP-binding protein